MRANLRRSSRSTSSFCASVKSRLSYSFLNHDACASSRFIFQHIDIRKPNVTIEPELTHPFTVDQTSRCWSMSIENNRAFALSLKIFECFEWDLVIADRDKYKHVARYQLLNILRDNGIHVPGLPFKAVINIRKTEADDIALIVLRSNVFEINAAISLKNFAHIVLIDTSYVRYRDNLNLLACQDRQRDSWMRYTTPLLN